MKRAAILVLSLCLAAVAAGAAKAPAAGPLVTTPPMGWNSFDSYGLYLSHETAMRNLEEMAARYKRFGYEYFVIDAGWFGEYKLVPGTQFPLEKHAADVRIDAYGRLQPSECYFPQGLGPIIDRCHALGLKFGLHLMRGIPRKAVELDTPVLGTPYTARQIADTTSVCSWCPQNYGVDMRKPGAQEFYNSLVAQMAAWGVDFIKYDDIVPFPAEVEAVARAIEASGRSIVLSLSPGGTISRDDLPFFRLAQMLRVTADVWDERPDIDACFEAWRRWQGAQQEGFYIDMDMIPFGELQIMSPLPEGLSGNETKADINRRKRRGELSNVELLSGRGWHRVSALTRAQHYTFITMRALAASPLMIGGDLVSMDEFSYGLLTDKEMLSCNQNGVMGAPVWKAGAVESWLTPSKAIRTGWAGVFNRDARNPATVTLSAEVLGFDPAKATMMDIWGKAALKAGQSVTIEPDGVLFIKYTLKK